MEVDMLEKIPDWATMQLEKNKVLAEELAREGLVVFEDELLILHHASYQKDSRKISLQRISIKGKQAIDKCGSEIEIKNMNPSDIMELHWEIGEALAHTVDDQERENAKLKKRIVELEASLSPRPLFVEPLAIVHSFGESLRHAHKIDKATQLLSQVICCRRYQNLIGFDS